MFKLKPLYMALLGAALYSAPSSGEQTLEDPMRPPTEAGTGATNGKVNKGPQQKAGPGYTLSAIRIAHDHRSAIINGKSVTIGDRIGNARVIDIRAAGTTLQQNGKVIPLPLLPISIKTQVEAQRP